VGHARWAVRWAVRVGPCGGLCELGRAVHRAAATGATSNTVVLERMALLLWSGGPWRTLGAVYTTVFQTSTRWTAVGVFERAYAAVLRLERRPLKRNVRVECIDSSYAKSGRSAQKV